MYNDKDWPGKQPNLCSTHWLNNTLLCTVLSCQIVEYWYSYTVNSEHFMWFCLKMSGICGVYTTLLDTPMAVSEPSIGAAQERVARLHWYVFNSRCLTLCARPGPLFLTLLWDCDWSWWLWDYMRFRNILGDIINHPNWLCVFFSWKVLKPTSRHSKKGRINLWSDFSMWNCGV